MSEDQWTILANDIRLVDGNHDLGAGELAARLSERGWTRAAIAEGPRAGWDDFEPDGDREELAYALMVAGIVVDVPGGAFLDLALADRIIEALKSRDLGIAAATPSPETTPAGGTTTDCPLEGVHEHAFRGPHRFHEWDPGTPPAAVGPPDAVPSPFNPYRAGTQFHDAFEEGAAATRGEYGATPPAGVPQKDGLDVDEETRLRERHWTLPARGGSADIDRLLSMLDDRAATTLRSLLDEVETLCDDNGQNAIRVDDLAALIRDRLALPTPQTTEEET